MKNVALVIFAFMGATSTAYGEPNGGRGGGSGCMSEIYRVAGVVSTWLDKSGSTLKPAVSSDEFLKALNPNQIQFVPQTQDLIYEGNPVDAFFDGQTIQVRCDRLQADSPDAQNRVVAHETLRKLGLEGDDYEVSRQIPILSVTRPSFASGDFDILNPVYVGDGYYFGCGLHVEVSGDMIVTTMISSTGAVCDDVGDTRIYSKLENGKFVNRRDTGTELIPLTDGNLVVDNSSYPAGTRFIEKFVRRNPKTKK